MFYFTDMGQLAAVRHNNYKVHFMIQEAHGFDVWKNPYTPLAWPSLVNLRADPFERAMHESIGYDWWATKRMFSISAAAVITTDFLTTFLDYPPRQEPGSFNVDKTCCPDSRGSFIIPVHKFRDFYPQQSLLSQALNRVQWLPEYSLMLLLSFFLETSNSSKTTN